MKSRNIIAIIIILVGLLWLLNSSPASLVENLRFTRNQSYDIRGDPFPISYNPGLSQWNMSSWGPTANAVAWQAREANRWGRIMPRPAYARVQGLWFPHDETRNIGRWVNPPIIEPKNILTAF